jgi:hypothetical protein
MFKTKAQLLEEVRQDPNSWYAKYVQGFLEAYESTMKSAGVAIEEDEAQREAHTRADEAFPTMYYNYIVEDEEGIRRLAVLPGLVTLEGVDGDEDKRFHIAPADRAEEIVALTWQNSRRRLQLVKK